MKVLDVLYNILFSIIALILGILGAICLIPLVVIYLLVYLPTIAVASVWEKDKPNRGLLN